MVCGGPLGAEIHWVVDGRGGRVHHRCRDWRNAPFPFDRQITTLRRIVIELRGAAGEVIAAGTALRRMQRTWPIGGREAYDEGERRIALVRERLERIAQLARRLW